MAPQPAAGHPPLEDRTAPNGYNADHGAYPTNTHNYEEPETQQRHTNGLGIDTSFTKDDRYNGGMRDMGYDSNASAPSPVDGRLGRNKENGRSGNNTRDGSRTNGGVGAKSSGTLRTCGKCNEPLTGQFVRALGGTFHLDCFKCRDCGLIVASKFFPVDDEEGHGQYPLCETDYFRRLDLLCFDCGGALRGSYITALDRKYHIEHFTCSVCPTVFGAQDSYYEHEGKVYCHYHYSTQFAQRCNGCQTAILKQFVEIFRNGQNQHWHPECYMIHKFWNVRLTSNGQAGTERPEIDPNVTEQERNSVKDREERMEEKVYKIWSILQTFEESSAACISDMLLHVSNGAYVDGVVVAKRFIWHVDVLFSALDRLASLMTAEGLKELSYAREAKLLCKKIVAFFTLLSKTQETGVRKLGVTQELLSLVTSLAHYLKLLVRIGLQGALKLERERHTTEGLHSFLDEIGDLEAIKEAEQSQDLTAGVAGLADQHSDCCMECKDPIDDECFIIKGYRWHQKPAHLFCSSCGRDLSQDLDEARWDDQEDKVFCGSCTIAKGKSTQVESGFRVVTKLQQYIFLLKVALARLLALLKKGGSLPHTSDDPNLSTYASEDGHRLSPSGDLQNPTTRVNTRSQSYAGASRDPQNESSLEQTVGEMRRLRSTRNERTLSTTFRKARASRIIDGPEGRSVRPGSAGADGSDSRNHGFQIVEERDANGEPRTELTFGNQDALTLDDIPRIVAAEQAKEQRPNAYKHARNNLIGSGGRAPKLMNGHQRSGSGGGGMTGEPSPMRTKKYFSELSALEYFIVRHVAVLSMEPLLEGQFNLEELLGLIESRKPTFWGKVGKAFKNDGRKGGKRKGVFGANLETVIEKDGVESTNGVGPGALRIPAVIDDSIAAMRQMDMSVEGVFRKNGNIRRLKELAELIDMKDDSVDLTKENPVQIAALLKKFLREMPEPLLTTKLHRLFICSQKIQDEDKRRRVLHLTCCLLPKMNRDTMEILFAFLNWTASFSHVDEESGSKMDVHNLATVMTPNILYSNRKEAGVDDSFLAIEAVTSLIDYNDNMCEVPEDLVSILNDTSLFNSSSDITTKEILKRYGDIARTGTMQQQRPGLAVEQSASARAKESSSRGNAPVITRVDTDLYQANAWQKQSSVRHVQGPGGAPPGSQMTPPQQPYDLNAPNSPFRQRQGSDSSQNSYSGMQERQNYRQSGAQAPLGVTS